MWLLEMVNAWLSRESAGRDAAKTSRVVICSVITKVVPRAGFWKSEKTEA